MKTIRHFFTALAAIALLPVVALPLRAQTFQTLQSWPAQTNFPRTELCKGSDGNFYGITRANGSIPGGSGCIYRVTPQGAMTILHAFGRDFTTGPGLIQARDGFFYGMTKTGSTNRTNNNGTFYRLGMDGSFTTLLNFSSTGASYPQGTLVEGSDGNFYGTSSSGPGTVFKLTPGGQFTLLAPLSAATGTVPLGRLVIGADGNFFGTTSSGGTSGRGTIFKVTPGGTLTVLFHFPASGAGNPNSGLTKGNDGNFYGTANNVFYRVTPQGIFTALYTFVSATGLLTSSELVLGSDGFFYGTTIRGATNGYGGVYRMSSAGAYTQVRDFDDRFGETNSGDFASVIEGEPGILYGVTSGSTGPQRGTVFKVTTGGTLSVLNNFSSGGKIPSGPLLEGDDGNFFGTLLNDNQASGAVYKLDSSGAVTTLQEFSYYGTIGQTRGGLIKGLDGMLYGLSDGSIGNYGVAYKIAQTGGNATALRTLTEFPIGRLVQAGDGNFYGVTYRPGYNPGTVFKLTPSGTLTTIFTFFTSVSGAVPNGPLTLGSDGNLYGTAKEGGSNGLGTIFRVTPGANPTFTTVFNFTGANGRYPVDVLVSAPDGNLYGTTLSGGTNSGGTLFKLTMAGVHSMIADFGTAGAISPRGAVAISAAGDFYGVASGGGAGGVGCVYRVTAGGVLSVLHSFGGTGPRVPMGGLIFGPDGLLYGTTTAGGANSLGTVFKITMSGGITHFQHFDYRTGSSTLGELFRASSGTIYGLNQAEGTGGGGTLFQIGIQPVATTLAATNTSLASATLNASVNPSGTATTAVFEYGPTTGYGTTTTIQSVGAGGEAVAVAQAISGLAPHTLYHFRVKATNPSGTTFGSDATFTTANTAPSAPNGTATGTSGTQKTITLGFPATDADGDAVNISSATGSANVTVNSFTATTVTFTPAVNFLGDATFTYTVSDGFGGTATGTITVTVVASGNPDLSNLVVSAGILTPAFSSATTSYTADVSFSVTTLTVTPTKADPNATIKVNGITVASGTASGPVSLGVGGNTITTVVTAQDGVTNQTYTVNVRRQTIIETWRETYFGNATGFTGNLQDFDHDGVLNLFEFAFGTDPTVRGGGPLQYNGTLAGGGTIGATGQPITVFEPTATGIDYRALFVRRVDHVAAGLTYTPQFSTDLQTWVPSAVVPSVLADDGINQIVSVPYPPFVGGKKTRFFRISVTLAP